MNKKHTLLIDVGSTHIKVGLYNDITKELTKSKYSFPEPTINHDNLYEVCLDSIWEIIHQIINENIDEITDVLISVQMHGFILFNKDYKPITNFISWQDQRGISMMHTMHIPYDHGLKLKPNLPWLSIQYMKKNHPLLFDQEVHVMTLGSYLSFKLTGKNITHVTDAFSLGSLNVVFNQYTRSPLVLPISTLDIVEIGQYRNVKIYSPMGDHQVSMYAIEKNTGYILNLGTSGQICIIDDELKEGPFESRPFMDGQYIHTVTGIYGGKFIRENADAPDIVENLYKEYEHAISNLPKREYIVVTGGATKYFKHILDKVLNKLGLPYFFNEKDAINGLAKVKEKIDKMQIGTMLSEFNITNIPIIFKQSGLDFFILDYEHGGFDYNDLLSIITIARLSHIKVFVRLSDNSRKDITKIMDMAPDGLILPMTSTVDDIKKVVEYALYYPMGKRGLSTMRAHSFYNPPKDSIKYMVEANSRIKIFAQIETSKGVENYQKIVEIDGVSGVFIGPNDLSASYKDPGNVLNDEVIKAINHIGHHKAKLLGMITTNKKHIEISKKLKFDYLSIGSELSILKQAYQVMVQSHKKEGET